MGFVLIILFILIGLGLLAVAFILPSGIRFGAVGGIIGIVIALPIAFLLSMFRVWTPPISVGGAYVTALIWMPAGAGILGVAAGLVIGKGKK